MSDPKAPAPAAGKVAIIDPDGRFGFIDAKYAEKIAAAGGRVLSNQELKEREAEAAYEGQSAGQKALGIAKHVTPLGQLANAISTVSGHGGGDAPPQLEAFREGTGLGATGGLHRLIAKKAIEEVGGKEASDAYAERGRTLGEAFPATTTAGEMAGFAGSTLVGGGATRGAAGAIGKALPANVVSRLGALAEQGVGKVATRALGNAATETALGRAATTAAEMGVRGAVEGGALGGLNEATRELTYDPEVSADKVFSSIGTGALWGGALGAGTGAAGSLVKSGVTGAISKARGVLGRGGEAAASGAAEEAGALAPKTADEVLGAKPLPFVNPDAGLAGGRFAAESPIAIGSEMRPLQLRPGGAIRKVSSEPAFGFNERLTIDPDAGLATEAGPLKSPFSIGEPSLPSAEERLGEAIARTNAEGKHGGLVPIGDLRKSFPDLSREAFDDMLLRAEKGYKVDLKLADDPKAIRGTFDGILRQDASGGGFRGKNHLNWVVARDLPEVASAIQPGEVGVSRSLTTRGSVAAEAPALARGFTPSILDAEAGIARRASNGKFQGPIPTEPALKLSSAKKVPRRLELDTGGLGEVAAEGAPIALPKVGGATVEAAGETAAAKPWHLRKADELAFDALGATKGQMTKAVQNVKGGAEAVGEYVNRMFLKPAAEGADGALGAATAAGRVGRADQLLEAIQADKAGRIAQGLENAVRGTPARFDLDALAQNVSKMHAEMLRDPVRQAGADAFLNRITGQIEAIGRTPGRIAADGTIDAADAFQIRAALERTAYEVGGGTNSAAKDAYKAVMRQWDGQIVDTIDKAAADAGKSGIGDEIRHWKREWQLASAAESAAEGGTERVRGNNTFGIRESIGGLVGLATGHPVLGIATGIAGKVARERGSAAGAALLNHLGNSRSIADAIAKVDAKMASASRGLLAAPEKRPLPFKTTERPRAIATRAIQQIAALQADPLGTADAMSKHVEGLADSHPELAQGIVARQTAALSFLASKAPTIGQPDPLAPHQKPSMTDTEAATFAKYVFYADKPERFFDELQHGKITPEGAETAKALMPAAFAELQERMNDAIASHMARGRSIPYQQRLKIGTLLDFPATPDQRPEYARFLQQNVLPLPSTPKPAKAPAPASATKPQRSVLDRIASDGIGRRA